ncbi:hypothetical protein POCGH01_00102200 [Plasmodium ovale]|uniref:Uncharacterized protein n=1 Tax=Plasmodium ovale TaxID=36330 RepID=A0A1D3JC47_PLAOA|nr:hypothetical protein POCGH01_00102200 [Plasmodium ovale]
MVINRGKLKRIPKIHENFIMEAPNYKSSILFVNHNNIDTETTKELRKRNNSDKEYKLRLYLYVLPINICYKNAIPKFSLLMILFQVLILQFAVESNAETTVPNGDSERSVTSADGDRSLDVGSDGTKAADIVIAYLKNVQTYVESVVKFITTKFQCVLYKRSKDDCKHAHFIVPGIVGGVTLFISLIILFLYWRGMCCCKPPNTKQKGEDALRAQFEQMQQQMQLQQQHMYREMMNGYTTDDGEDEEDDEDDDDEEDEEDEEVEEDYKKGKGDKEKEKKENKARKKEVKKEKKKGKGEKKEDEGKKKEEIGKKKEDEGKKKEDEGKKKEEIGKKKDEGKKKEEKGKKKEQEGEKKEEEKGKKKEQEGEKKKEKGKKKEQEGEKKKEEKEKKDEHEGKQKARGNTHNTRKNNSKNDNIHIGYNATT